MLGEDGQSNPNPSLPGIVTYTGTVDDYVLSAENTGTNGTGSTLTGVDITLSITSPSGNSIVFDVFKSGAKSADAVNVNGIKDVNTTGFGDPAGGTYVGIGNTTLPASGYDPVNNSLGVSNAWEAEAEFNNGTDVTGAVNATKNTSTAGLDPNFINNTVHTYELAGILPAGSGTLASTGYVPFANIVVPTGSSGTAFIQIGGEYGPAQGYNIQFPASSNPTMKLSTSSPSGSNAIGTVTVSGGNGFYRPQTIAVPTAAQTNGYLAVNGFNPNTDEEIYGLGGAGLAGLASILDTTVAPAGASVVPVSSLSSDLRTILAGDTLAAIFPAGANPAGSPDYFSYNLAGTTATITSITVVPEPCGIGAITLAAVGLLSRRRNCRAGEVAN